MDFSYCWWFSAKLRARLYVYFNPNRRQCMLTRLKYFWDARRTSTNTAVASSPCLMSNVSWNEKQALEDFTNCKSILFLQCSTQLVRTLYTKSGRTTRGLHHRFDGRWELFDGSCLRYNLFSNVLRIKRKYGKSQKMSLSRLSKTRPNFIQIIQEEIVLFHYGDISIFN